MRQTLHLRSLKRSMIQLKDKYFKPYLSAKQIDTEIRRVSHELMQEYEEKKTIFPWCFERILHVHFRFNETVFSTLRNRLC